MQVPLFRLRCGVNSYEWGKIGHDSAAARFGAATELAIEPDKPYSELWMGTHPSNPSRDVVTGRTLLDLVAENQMLLSPAVAARFGTRLPFLFKVLSIHKALSIQAHPNKQLAAQLHAADPAHYPDDNHKPEMVIAVTPFEGLCGFRPLGEIAHMLGSVQALQALVGAERTGELARTLREEPADETATRAALKGAFAALMGSSADAVAAQAEALVSQARAEGDDFAGGGTASTSGRALASLVVRLHGSFGPDIGLFVLFFLNLVTLQPGEALFLVADDIHAYLSGDVIECMAESDNVVRAGLTPKFKDVVTLVDMLTYNSGPIESQKMHAVGYPHATLNRTAYSAGSGIVLYDPPIDEFAVVRTVLRGGDGAKATFDGLAGPSVLICTGGRGRISVGGHSSRAQDVAEGYVFFAGSTAELVLEGIGGRDESDFVTFRAFCEVDGAAAAAAAGN